MFYFLWGVFRVRKVNFSDSSKEPCVTGLNMASLDRDVSPNAMPSFENQSLVKHVDKDSSAFGSSHDRASVAYDSDKTCVAVNGNHDNEVVEQEYLGSQANSEQQHGRLDSGFSARLTTKDAQLYPEMRCTIPSLVMFISSACY